MLHIEEGSHKSLSKIIYPRVRDNLIASNEKDFALKAEESAKETRDEMQLLLKSAGLI